MAGGKGTRIQPLTLSRPKPLIPVANRPMIEYILKKLKIHGHNDIVVTLNYLRTHIKKLLKKNHPNFNAKFSIEKKPLGTAGGVALAQKYIDDTFFVLSGDVLIDVDFDEILKFHKKKKALATMILKPVNDPSHFGIAVLSQDNEIIKFLEKPSHSDVFSKIANTGTYIFEPEIMDYIDTSQGAVDFSNDVFPELINAKAGIYGYISEGYWNDVGRPDSFLNANHDVLNKKITPRPNGKILKESVGKFGDIWVGDNVEIKDKVRIIGPVVIGNDSIIEQNSVIGRNTVIGDNVTIKENTTIEGSVIFSKSIINSNSHLKNCIIDSECILDSGCVIEKGALLGNSVHVGPSSLISSNRSITNKVKILPESHVDSNFPL
ncbi:sugar phosphate nucleotidyltransferase [Methanobacterium alcaliphilum]|uniref:sugar phosphate nucleotidyltransferase n=1 Tax=Methanobacterium alcaliphilum TaxID=392018 RepID=UPI002009F8C3|nr:NDP-sugar synthase [Methanobacterium alcaliphilum]MCK9152305.1 NDP-sugar synthase [Methanobacterium alcaliphilum]